MGNIKIKSIHYSGDNYYYDSPEFTKGLNIIRGNNGSGKTTLCDLIYYALGGEVYQFKRSSSKQHKEITSDTNNFVNLILEINEVEYSIKRNIDDNNISINMMKNDTNSEEHYEYFPVNRNKDYAPYIFSDWFLEKLEIKNTELFDGYHSYTVNIKDLSRLFYYDQQTPPEKIYKNPVQDDHIQNSEFIRKVIFELLMGENYEDYYQSTNELKEAEAERTKAKGLLDEYQKTADEIRFNCDIDLNLTFAREKLNEFNDILRQQLDHRETIKNTINATNYDNELKALRTELISKEEVMTQIEYSRTVNYQEIFSIRDTERNLKIEINQLKKIIYTNEKIALFSFNTCPWCLKELPTRTNDNECFCGNSIQEDEKIVFEYNTEEYKTILKSRNKTLKTISETINEIEKENDKLKEVKEKIKKDILEIKSCILSGSLRNGVVAGKALVA